jgi:L-fuconolactonase
MTRRADAHIHLFDGGYQGQSFASRPGVSIDDVACYDSLAGDHDVAAALVVGFAGAAWCEHNNRHLAAQVRLHDWIHPVAYVAVETPPGIEQLVEFRGQGFVGISLYLYDGDAAKIASWPDETWSWLDEHNWLISVNADTNGWSSWPGVLERFPELRLLVSHLGEPPASTSSPEPETTAAALQTVTELVQFPGVSVKLSGFYAVSDPGHDYPHEAAWPYVERLVTAFGSGRLLWGSDFSPCLDWLTFPQTMDLFEKMPFLDRHDLDAITGVNLLALLEEVRRPGTA